MKKFQSLLIVLLISLSGFLSAAEILDLSQDVESDARVEIDIPFGQATITGWDQNQVVIKGELGELIESYTFREFNNRTYFKVELPSRRGCFWLFCGGGWNTDDYHSYLEIFVPMNASVSFEGINIEIAVSNLQGDSTIKTVNGPIYADDLSGMIDLNTVNGAIEGNNLNGRISYRAVNGRITDDNSSGSRVDFVIVNGAIESNSSASNVSISGVNGPIDLNLSSLDDLNISNVNGAIEASIDLNEQGYVNISSVNARVNLLFNEDVSANFHVSNKVGSNISNRLTDDEAERNGNYSRTSSLRFGMNGGSGRVEVSNFSGRISLDTH